MQKKRKENLFLSKRNLFSNQAFLFLMTKLQYCVYKKNLFMELLFKTRISMKHRKAYLNYYGNQNIASKSRFYVDMSHPLSYASITKPKEYQLRCFDVICVLSFSHYRKHIQRLF